jgi:nucleotide-binding universal stress UspA family protein
MQQAWGPHVVVGFDGSRPSLEALAWAVDEARARNVPLEVVHAVGGDPRGDHFIDGAHDARNDAVVEQALAQAAELDPAVVVRGTTSSGAADAALAAAAGPAGLVVVGARGRGGFTSRLLGSTSLALVRHAPCPAVVVDRLPRVAERRVVVGIDHDTAPDVVGCAFHEAAARRAELLAIHAWEGHDHLREQLAQPAAELRRTRILHEQEVLATALAPWTEKFPDVVVTRYVSTGGAANALVSHSAHLLLVVVGRGALGHAAVPGLGSTAEAVLHRSKAPVMVVPPR